MGKSQETFNKKEKEKKKQRKKQDKQQRKEERKANSDKGKSLEDMLAYVDENGEISSTPPDPAKKTEINSEDIQLSNAPREDSGSTVRSGTVTFFNESKGFGFIKDHETKESIFVHINNLEKAVKENDKVSFETEKGPKGLNAINVNIVS